MEFRILGPLEVSEDGEVVGIQGAKPRALLAVLLLRANEAVSQDELIEALWGARPPETAPKVVQTYVSQLRKSLHRNGTALLVTRGGGYELRADRETLDLARFEELASSGRADLAAGRNEEAAATLKDALALWRGAPLAEFRQEPFALQELRRLEEARISALEDRVEAELRCGAGGELVAELEALVEAEPLREHPRAQLMLALYRAGRQADALALYRETARTLREELGLDPGPELQQLERAILEQDASLTPPARTAEPAARPAPSRRRVVLAVGALAAAGLLAAILLAMRGGGTGVVHVAPNSLVAIDPSTLRVVRTVATGVGPDGVASADGDIWVSNGADATLSRFDARTLHLRRTIPLGLNPADVAAGLDAVWVFDASYGRLVRVAPGSNGVSRPVAVSDGCGGARASITTGAGSIWTACDFNATAVRVNPNTFYSLPFAYRAGLLTSTVSTAIPHFSDVLFGNGVLWIADRGRGVVTEIDPRTNLPVRQAPVGRDPIALADGAGAVWVADGADDSVSRLDGRTGVQRIALPCRPVGVAAGAGGVIVGCADGTIAKVDPSRNAVVKTIRLGVAPTALAIVAGRVFVAVAA